MSSAGNEEARMDADDEELAELRQRIVALEQQAMTLTAAIDWFGRWRTPAGDHYSALRVARVNAGLEAIAEAGTLASAAFDRTAERTSLCLRPELARFLGVPERVRAGQVTAALAHRMMMARPVSAAGRHKLLALADALDQLCTRQGAEVLITADPVVTILDSIVDPAPGCHAMVAMDLLRDDDLPAAALDRDGDLVVREALTTVIVEFISELVDETLGAPDVDDHDHH